MIDVRDLEIERHYLSEAIKSSHNSAEYDFLSRKLRSVEDELQGGPSSSKGDIDDDEEDRIDHVDRGEVVAIIGHMYFPPLVSPRQDG